MINRIKRVFGLAPKTDYANLIKHGAIIIDVRSAAEFSTGHIPGSMNISVETLNTNLGKLKDKNQVIITCCASGMRSASAKNFLKSVGYLEVYNGGGWTSLRGKI